MAGTTFPEWLKPLFAYNCHRYVSKNHEIVQACAVGEFVEFVVFAVVELEEVVMVLGGREDATTNKGMGWSNE